MKILLLLTILLSGCKTPRQTEAFSEERGEVVLDRRAYEHLGLTDEEIDDLMDRHKAEIEQWIEDHYDELLEMYDE